MYLAGFAQIDANTVLNELYHIVRGFIPGEEGACLFGNDIHDVTVIGAGDRGAVHIALKVVDLLLSQNGQCVLGAADIGGVIIVDLFVVFIQIVALLGGFLQGFIKALLGNGEAPRCPAGRNR